MTTCTFHSPFSFRFPLCLGLLLLGISGLSWRLYGADSEFRSYKLRDSIGIKLPASWKILDGKVGKAIEEGAKAAMDEAGVPSKEEILLNAVSDSAPLSSGIVVTLLGDKNSRADRAVTISDETLKVLDARWKSNMVGTLHAQGGRLLTWNGTRREKLDERTILTSEFLRTSPPSRDPAFCQQAFFFGYKRVVIINLWCTEKELPIWRPIFQRIKKSMVIP